MMPTRPPEAGGDTHLGPGVQREVLGAREETREWPIRPSETGEDHHLARVGVRMQVPTRQSKTGGDTLQHSDMQLN